MGGGCGREGSAQRRVRQRRGVLGGGHHRLGLAEVQRVRLRQYSVSVGVTAGLTAGALPLHYVTALDPAAGQSRLCGLGFDQRRSQWQSLVLQRCEGAGVGRV